MSIIIDGKKIAAKIEESLKSDIQQLKDAGKKIGLVVILVGDSAASSSYVKSKIKACERLGIHSKFDHLPADTSEDKLLRILDNYNESEEFTGILVQLPLPKHISEDKVIDKIDPKKDVDCFHPWNVGNLMIGKSVINPCTPAGMIELIRSVEPDTTGKHVVVIGRSNIVGKPIAMMLLQNGDSVGNCTVTICHSKTKNLVEECRRADILIAAIGKANFVGSEMVKEGSIIIDVGINRIDADNEKGYKIVGDVDFEAVKDKVKAISPVPGGVGKTTIAMLMKNTVELAKNN
jgi:methylenetetrahydrofolate dehydrogenase (NADP+) / methenyltetrahydrofolate cyclohydrolase